MISSGNGAKVSKARWGLRGQEGGSDENLTRSSILSGGEPSRATTHMTTWGGYVVGRAWRGFDGHYSNGTPSERSLKAFESDLTASYLKQCSKPTHRPTTDFNRKMNREKQIIEPYFGPKREEGLLRQVYGNYTPGGFRMTVFTPPYPFPSTQTRTQIPIPHPVSRSH